MIEEMKRKGKNKDYWLLSEVKTWLGLDNDYFEEVESLSAKYEKLKKGFAVTGKDIAMDRSCFYLWITFLPNLNHKVMLAKAIVANKAVAVPKAQKIIETFNCTEE